MSGAVIDAKIPEKALSRQRVARLKLALTKCGRNFENPTQLNRFKNDQVQPSTIATVANKSITFRRI